jgi:phosphotransferase system HPr-like phosphotransfer protein
MQESITAVTIGIRCIHMRTASALINIKKQYGVTIELCRVVDDGANVYVDVSDPLEAMLLGLQRGDSCCIKVEGNTGSTNPATTDVKKVLEAHDLSIA